MDAPHVISRKQWLHGEARCPSCGLQLDPHLDLKGYERIPLSSMRRRSRRRSIPKIGALSVSKAS
jgi:hypothetical protein